MVCGIYGQAFHAFATVERLIIVSEATGTSSSLLHKSLTATSGHKNVNAKLFPFAWTGELFSESRSHFQKSRRKHTYVCDRMCENLSYKAPTSAVDWTDDCYKSNSTKSHRWNCKIKCWWFLPPEHLELVLGIGWEFRTRSGPLRIAKTSCDSPASHCVQTVDLLLFGWCGELLLMYRNSNAHA